MQFGQSFVLLDFLTIAAGIFLIVAPNKAYMLGRSAADRERTKIPANWPRISRIIGVVAILFGLFFIYLTFGRGHV